MGSSSCLSMLPGLQLVVVDCVKVTHRLNIVAGGKMQAGTVYTQRISGCTEINGG